MKRSQKYWTGSAALFGLASLALSASFQTPAYAQGVSPQLDIGQIELQAKQAQQKQAAKPAAGKPAQNVAAQAGTGQTLAAASGAASAPSAPKVSSAKLASAKLASARLASASPSPVTATSTAASTQAKPAASASTALASADPAADTDAAKPKSAKRVAAGPAAAKGPYYVDFRARTAASYGHAFVWFGKTSEKKVDVAGLHPAGDATEFVVGHLLPVPAETGASYGDLDPQYLTANYRVYMNEADAKRVFAYIRHLQATHKLWNEMTNNCTTFLGQIASYMGLKTPFYLKVPEDYVNSLKELNGGKQFVQLAPESTGFFGASNN